MAGNEHVSVHHYREALDKYLRAFRMDPHQPLTSLCIATTLAYIAVHPLTARKQDVCGKAVAFFSHYCQMRLMTGECNGRVDINGLKQEVYYNIGCFFTEIRLAHLAEDFFLKALRLFDENVCTETGTNEREASFPLTREAAFNLSIIYRKSGNDRLAREIMLKYLNFEKTQMEG